jgi:hypothetical protein
MIDDANLRHGGFGASVELGQSRYLAVEFR